MRVECMYCHTLLQEDEEDTEVSSGICSVCLTIEHPEHAKAVRALSFCEGCQDRTFKCQIIACDILSKELDLVDIELKARGQMKQRTWSKGYASCWTLAVICLLYLACQTVIYLEETKFFTGVEKSVDYKK